MKSKLFTASLLASAMFAALGSSPALAQNVNTPAVDRAQATISARIQQGLASGHITPSEARELYRRDREIDVREARFKSDGRATPQERQQLRADLDSLAADVERMMANRDVTRPGNTNGIDNRQANIGERIDEGVSSGRISQREARRLYSWKRDIARMERRFMRDGVLNPQERRQLRNELSKLRAEVERMINDDRRGRR